MTSLIHFHSKQPRLGVGLPVTSSFRQEVTERVNPVVLRSDWLLRGHALVPPGPVLRSGTRVCVLREGEASEQ